MLIALPRGADDVEVGGLHVDGMRSGSAATWYRLSSSASAPACSMSAACRAQPPVLVALRLAMTGTDDCAFRASINAR